MIPKWLSSSVHTLDTKDKYSSFLSSSSPISAMYSEMLLFRLPEESGSASSCPVTSTSGLHDKRPLTVKLEIVLKGDKSNFQTCIEIQN